MMVIQVWWKVKNIIIIIIFFISPIQEWLKTMFCGVFIYMFVLLLFLKYYLHFWLLLLLLFLVNIELIYCILIFLLASWYILIYRFSNNSQFELLKYLMGQVMMTGTKRIPDMSIINKQLGSIFSLLCYLLTFVNN